MIAFLGHDFFLRALVAGIAIALVAAPLGCFVVWRRMAYVGEAIAQAGLMGVALGFLLSVDLTAAVLAVAFVTALLLIALNRQDVVPFDSVLGLVAHAALAFGVLATALLGGRSVDLMSFLFGDIYAVSGRDLAWVLGAGAVALTALAWLWQPMLALSINEELAAAEGIDTQRTKTAFIILLALVIAIVMKIVGILLTVAFLIMPAAAARPLARTPEQMVALAAALGSLGVVGGLSLSASFDTQGGPSIVAVLSVLFVLSLAVSHLRRSAR